MHWLARFLMLATIAEAAEPMPLSPTGLATSADRNTLYIACASGQGIVEFSVAQRKVVSAVPMPGVPSGLVLSSSGKELFVTCAPPESKVCIIDLTREKITATIPVRHTATAPVLSPDGRERVGS